MRQRVGIHVGRFGCSAVCPSSSGCSTATSAAEHITKKTLYRVGVACSLIIMNTQLDPAMDLCQPEFASHVLCLGMRLLREVVKREQARAQATGRGLLTIDDNRNNNNSNAAREDCLSVGHAFTSRYRRGPRRRALYQRIQKRIHRGIQQKRRCTYPRV
jgi:hypothetical protein